MPLSKIPINKGVFKVQNPQSLANSEFCEELINLMIDQAGANFDRPSLSLLTTLDSVEPIGMYWFGDFVVIVTTDRKVYSMTTLGTVTDVTGTSLPGSARPTFADDGTNVYIVGGGAPIYWGGLGTTTALLGGSPPNMTHLVYLDGYLIGNRRVLSEKNKVVQWADFEDTDSWTAANIFSAVGDPDEVQGLIASQRELYVVGEQTTEVWQNIGSFPVPFARAHVWQYGTPSPYSITEADNSVFFLDQNRRIMRIVGRQPQRISEGIESDLAGYTNITDCFSGSFTWKGSIHVLFIFPLEQKAWSVDLKNGQWSEWVGYSSGRARARIHCFFYLETEGIVFAGDHSTGRVFTFSDSVKTDAGGIFERARRFSYIDRGASTRKRVNLMRCQLKRNVASAYTGTTPQTNPTIELRWKDDDKTWSDWRSQQLGERGTNKSYVEFYRLGMYRTRQYELRMSDPAEFNLVSVETDEAVMAR